ncbi:uncharacterized protein VICG_00782 [Vittaforma corneae ATCC 50505]|uniref:Uncharacterized protein n=1 Tax=Vittaforma corneae (strain ATCC 50505) TaxID=993615 RepID=L2GNG2_VITCO|nr:uncharacterized protein VICG_00782 [Vittaforma corneae ATCC 50505]ELA42139.1 hypothetical protein VICG_00782 [Vittaforma corneae ATCC 50505]
MLFPEIRRIRTPLFKNISHANIDKSSELYLLYKKRNLTSDYLINSTENMFVIAFFYNELFDIKDYLAYLRELSITNQSYNIIKYYLKEICTTKFNCEMDSSHSSLKNCKDFLNSFFDSYNKSKDNIQAIILKIMKGELYRMVKIPVDDFDPYFFIGYCTIGDTFLPNFESTFDLFITKSINIVKVLNDFEFYNKTDDNQVPQATRLILKHLEICIDYLITENILSKIVEYIRFDNVGLDLIYKICCYKETQKIVFKKLMNISDYEKYLTVALHISSDIDSYKAIKDHAIGRIRGWPSVELPPRYVLEFLLIHFYYEYNSFDYHLLDEICGLFNLTDTVEYKLITKRPGLLVDEDIFYKIRDCKDFNELTRLFASFIYLCSFDKLALDDQLLELPEKFFSIGLSTINSETARNLKIYNDNPFNERLRKNVYLKIDRSIFVRYLIKRYKIFNEIDFLKEEYSAYENLMDDKYKVMYALYNLEWASKHIEELNRIGISDKLYCSLKSSPFKDCLMNAGLKGNKQTEIEKDSMAILTMPVKPEDDEAKRMKYTNTDKNTSNQHTIILESQNGISCLASSESTMLNNSDNIDSHQQQTHNSSSPQILQGIVDAFKNEHANFSSLICKIQASDEYVDILKSLFRWTYRTKYFMHFLEFYKQSIIRFELTYEDVKNITLELVKKFKDTDIVKLSASSLFIKDLYNFINDFSNFNTSVIEGISMKIDKNPNSIEYHDFVHSLVHSTVFNYVVVGSKLYSHLNNATFSLDHLLTYKSDDVLLEAVKQLKINVNRTINCNEVLLNILYSRGLTDELSALICKKLYIPDLSTNDLQRIYFFILP